MFSLGLDKYVDRLTEISVIASREYALEKVSQPILQDLDFKQINLQFQILL